MKHKLENALFLKSIRKTRALWKNDKAFAKIVEKMEKGKDLEKKEFDAVYWALWIKGHNHQ